MSDKRKHERKKKNLKSEVHSNEGLTFSTTINVSDGGIFISTPEPLKSGSEIDLLIKIPGGEEISVKGVVRWSHVDDHEEEMTGMGVEFIDLDADNLHKIQKV